MEEAIVTQGANARALGRTEFDNPFLKSENCPGLTGESVIDWAAKHDAWHFGWTMEDAVSA